MACFDKVRQGKAAHGIAGRGMVWQATFGAGGKARQGEAAHGTARRGKVGQAWLGEADCGKARWGSIGARFSKARQVEVWQGLAGVARQETVRLGKAGYGKALLVVARRGVVWHGEVRQAGCGLFRQGAAGFGKAWFGQVRSGRA